MSREGTYDITSNFVIQDLVMVDAPKGFFQNMAILNSFTTKYDEVGLTETANLSNKIKDDTSLLPQIWKELSNLKKLIILKRVHLCISMTKEC